MALYTLTAFSIWRGFCMSGQKVLDPTTYVWIDKKKISEDKKIVVNTRISLNISSETCCQ